MNKKKDTCSDGKNAPPGTRNVRRTISILRTVAKYQGKNSNLSHLARSVDLPISTTKRILDVLTAENILTFHRGSKQFYLGQEMYNMVQPLIRKDIQEKYHSSLVKIAMNTEDSVYLVVRSGFEAVCIDVAEGPLAVRISYGIGSIAPLGLMSSGLAILATLPREEVEAIVEKNKSSYSEYNLRIDEIWEQITTYQKKGYVIHKSYFIEGLVGISVPVFNAQGQVIASVTDSSTEQRMTKERILLIKKLIDEELTVINTDHPRHLKNNL